MKLKKIKTMIISSTMIVAGLTSILAMSFAKNVSMTDDDDPIKLVNEDITSEYYGRTLRAVNAGTTSLSDQKAAISVRMGNVPGMRFKYELSADVINGAFTNDAASLDGYTYGVVVAKSEALNPYDLKELLEGNKDLVKGSNANVNYDGEYGTIKLYNSIANNKVIVDNNVCFASVLTGFENVDEAKRANLYNSNYVAVAYVMNGDEVHFSAATEYNYLKAVNTYLADTAGFGLTDEQVAVLTDIKDNNTIVHKLTGTNTPVCFSVKQGSSYGFVDKDNTGTFVSNNKGIDSSTATMEITILDDGVLSLDYVVSTEADSYESYGDTCYIKHNTTDLLVDESWGEETAGLSGIHNGSLKDIKVKKGDKITFKYSKIYEGNGNDDTFTVSNICFVSDQGLYTKSQLSFDSMGGTPVEAITAYNGFAIDAPKSTKEGYRLEGWYTSSSYDVAFDFNAGLSKTTKVYAKWVEQVTVSIYDGATLITSVGVDKGSAYTPILPETFTKIVNGYYTDSALVNEWTVGSVVDANLDLYLNCETLESKLAPSGVLSSAINKADYVDGNETEYEWTIVKQDNGLTSLTPTNKGVGSSASSITMVVQKDTILSFNYSGSSERNYDKFQVFVKSADASDWGKAALEKSGVDADAYSGSYWVKLAAGDSVSIAYRKDGSGDKGDDQVTITDLKFTDGLPTTTINYVYNDGQTADSSSTAEYCSNWSNELLAAPINVRDENVYNFGGWYYDEALENKVEKGSLINVESVTLYAKWLEKVTITFVIPVGSESFSFNANEWAETPVEIENPTLSNRIFRGWYKDAEYNEAVDLSLGVLEDCTLYGKFEEYPIGSSKERAHELVMADSSVGTINATTTEEFPNYYFKFTPVATNDYYILLDYESISNKVIDPSYTSWNYPSDAKYSITDSDGATILSSTSFATSAKKQLLESGKTYYITCSLGGDKYKAWGNFVLEMVTYEHDSSDEAIDYVFGETVTIQNLFVSRDHELVYKFTTDENTSGEYKLTASGTGWSNTTVYSDAALSNKVVSLNNSSDHTSIASVKLEANTTYYVVVINNWSASELATKNTSFSISEYDKGYTFTNPSPLTVNTPVTTDFTKGLAQYYSFTSDAETAYKVTISANSSTWTKRVSIYSAGDSTKSLATYTTSSSTDEVKYINLPAGSYVVKVEYTSTSANVNYSVTVAEAAPGEHYLSAIALPISSASEVNETIAAGLYYKVTVDAEKLYKFTSSSDDSVITLYSSNGTSTFKTGTKELVAKLSLDTVYYLVVSNDATLNVVTVEEWQDGTSVDTPFVVLAGANCATMDTDDTANHTVYYKFTATEDGTYAFYTLNNKTIDTKLYLYDDEAYKNQIAYKDDGGEALMKPLGGYMYDSYSTFTVTAGTTYYIKVTYNMYGSSVGASLTLNIVAQ